VKWTVPIPEIVYNLYLSEILNACTQIDKYVCQVKSTYIVTQDTSLFSFMGPKGSCEILSSLIRDFMTLKND
jgi:hypothetical protein